MPLTHDSLAELAHSAAESIIAGYVVRAGGHKTLHWDDDRFDAERDALATVILTHLEWITP